MPGKTILAKAGRFFRFVYLKLFRINDTPQRVAIGLGIGVFSGVLPGTGPLAALFLAFVFKVNRASALLGSVLTNTWLSIPAFLLSLKAGAALTGISRYEVHRQWELFIKHFHWGQLLGVSVYKIIFPVLIGYFAVSVFMGSVSYVAALIVLDYLKKRNKHRSGR
jgi:uncharacterized protein (DUF2062 family)